MSRLELLKFRPTLREKVWGTHDIDPLDSPAGRRIGEAWCLHDGSKVALGPLQGRSVASLVREFGERLMGASWRPSMIGAPGAQDRQVGLRRGSFPLVGKLLFGAGKLSIQVHPDNASAWRLERATGKTELWYVTAAKPGAELGLGTLARLEPGQLATAATEGSIEKLLRWIPARPGECVVVPAGTVHSIRGGAVLCEIQQNSDLTYRLYDYRRTGLDGELRPLQIERAVEVSNTVSRPEPKVPVIATEEPCRTMRLGNCPYFEADLLTWSRPYLYSPDPRRCQLLLIVRGFGTLQGIPFDAGDAFLVPAESARFPVDGWKAQAVRAYLP